jgi:hypothetical protein
MPAPIYIRFAQSSIHPETGLHDGVFSALYTLPDGHDLTEHQRQMLEEQRYWFKSNLPIPDRFNRTSSKGYHRRNTKGVSWFKPTAKEHIARIRDVIVILQLCGYHIKQFTSSKPGYIVYEDEFQIVAEPFNDTQG